MEATEPFCVMDCSLVRCATGRVCSNLRELLEAIRTVPDAVLEHHMMRCALEDHFELHEFPNDLARWCWTVLGDNVLGEQLGLVDPYQQPSIGRAARGAGQHDRGSAVGPGPRAVVPARPGIAPDRIAADRLRHGRADRHARGAVGGHRADVAAVAVLPRPRSAAADGGPIGRFLAVAGAMRRRAVAGGARCGQSTSTSST